MHTESNIANSKAASSKEFLERLNSTIQGEAIPFNTTDSLLDDLLPSVDIVLDYTDNFFNPTTD